jgi:hypothetical protein
MRQSAYAIRAFEEFIDLETCLMKCQFKIPSEEGLGTLENTDEMFLAKICYLI